MNAIVDFVKVHKRLVIIAVIVLGVPALGIAWWLGSPLFINREVDEDFPLAAAAVVPAGMSMADAEATMVTASEMDEQMIEEDMMEAMGEMLAPDHVKSGEFRDADSFHRGSGSATIWDLGTDGYVLRFEDFRVTNGPDLRVLLSTHSDPMGRGDVNGSAFVELDSLKGNVGNQNYLIPDDVDVDDHHSVVIYCWPFQVVFSVAPLSSQ